MVFTFVVAMMIFGGLGWTLASSREKDPIVWTLICAILGPIGLFMLLILPSAKIPGDVTDTDEMRKWRTLVEVDAEISEAASKVRAFGPEYEALLARKYLALEDKQYIPRLVEIVSAEAKASQDKQIQMSVEPTKGSVGQCLYRRNPDGTYTITRGYPFTGREYKTFEEMEADCK